jgi:hypothetical protein
MRHHRACIDNGFLAVAALAVNTPNSRLSDDVALTKATVSLLAARDTPAVRDRLDPGMGQVSDDKLLQMSDLIGASEPTSIGTIWATETHNLQTGDGNSRILLEYGLTGKWVIVDAVVKTLGASKRLYQPFLTANTLPLRERVSPVRQGADAIPVSGGVDCRDRIHRLGDHHRLQTAYRLAQMGAHRRDAVGADAYRSTELEYRTGVGPGGHQQSGRARHSSFRPSLSHGPVRRYRDSRSVSLRFGATHRLWLLDLAAEMVAKMTAAGIAGGSKNAPLRIL